MTFLPLPKLPHEFCILPGCSRKRAPDRKGFCVRCARERSPLPNSRPILKSARSRELARIPLGESILSQQYTAMRGPGSLQTITKRIVRRFLCAPDARWKTTLTNKGIRITRVA